MQPTVSRIRCKKEWSIRVAHLHKHQLGQILGNEGSEIDAGWQDWDAFRQQLDLRCKSELTELSKTNSACVGLSDKW